MGGSWPLAIVTGLVPSRFRLHNRTADLVGPVEVRGVHCQRGSVVLAACNRDRVGAVEVRLHNRPALRAGPVEMRAVYRDPGWAVLAAGNRDRVGAVEVRLHNLPFTCEEEPLYSLVQ